MSLSTLSRFCRGALDGQKVRAIAAGGVCMRRNKRHRQGRSHEPSHRGEFTFSPYTHHFSNNPEHKKVVLVAIDEQLPGDRLCGVSFFSNSFGQPSVYVYAGQQFNNLWGVPQLFAKVTGGIMYG